MMMRIIRSDKIVDHVFTVATHAIMGSNGENYGMMVWIATDHLSRDQAHRLALCDSLIGPFECSSLIGRFESITLIGRFESITPDSRGNMRERRWTADVCTRKAIYPI